MGISTDEQQLALLADTPTLPFWRELWHGLRHPGPPPPGWLGLAVKLTLGTAIVCLLLIGAGVAIHGKNHHYFAEKKIGTFTAVAAFAIAAWVCLRMSSELLPAKFGRFWRAFAIVLIIVALDDLVRVHERIDRWIHLLLGWDPHDQSTDSIDDWIVVGYGLVAGWLWWRHFRMLLRLRWMMLTLAAAFAGFVAMVVCDMAHGPKALEESLKNLSAVLILLAMIAAQRDPGLATIAGLASAAKRRDDQQ